MVWHNQKRSFNASDTSSFDDEKVLSSSFNEQIAEMQRLNERWRACDSAAVSGMYDKWRWNLDVIWRMLIARACQLHPTEFCDEHERLDNNISTVIKTRNKKMIYESLKAMDTFLRLLESRVGVGSIMKENAYDMID